MMSLTVRYQPTGEQWQEHELENGVTISYKRNGWATANVRLPNIPAISSLEGYGRLQVLYDGEYLFDGTTQNKSHSKHDIMIKAYDRLWDFKGIRRSFEQSTFTKSPSEIFTNIFDQDGTSTYMTGIWGETFSEPWIANYDATTYVVPSEGTTDAFDTRDDAGTDYMDYLAKVSYRGDKFKYFYWFECIDGNWYLHFEPDGWGKTWKNVAYTVTEKFTETWEGIWNDIVVWGNTTAGIYPKGEQWTEKTIDGWYSGGEAEWTNISVSVEETIVDTGGYSVKLTGDFDSTDDGYIFLYREFSNSLNLDSIIGYNGANHIPFNNVEVVIRLTDSSANTADADLLVDAGGAAWRTTTGTGGKTDWVEVGSFDWTDVVLMTIRFYFLNAHAANTYNIYLDNLYFDLGPTRSEQSAGNGYDATSVAAYNKRTSPPVTNRNFIASNQCNVMAETLCQYHKDPQYTQSIRVNGLHPAKINHNFEITDPVTVTLPVDSKKITFAADGVITTDFKLGTPRLSFNDVMKKLYSDLIKEQTDQGLTYETGG